MYLMYKNNIRGIDHDKDSRKMGVKRIGGNLVYQCFVMYAQFDNYCLY